MSHVRQQARDLIVAALNTTAYTTYSSRVYPLGSSTLPTILVYTRDESSEPITTSYPRTVEKSLQLIVEVYHSGASDTIDDILDDIIIVVENTLNVQNSLYKDISLSNTVVEFSDDGEKPLGVATLTYQIIYHTKEDNAEVAV